MIQTLQPVEMELRVSPSRPYRLGTRRRRPRPAVAALPEAGASRSGRKPGAHSLDTEKYLETSVEKRGGGSVIAVPLTVRAWAAGERTEEDLRIEQWSLKKQLTSTVYQIWQDKAHAAADGAEARWFNAREAEWKLRDGENDTARCLRVKAWEKANKLTGKTADALKWFKQYEQLTNCQAQWIGYRAACCGASTRPVAVPIGCGHRL